MVCVVNVWSDHDQRGGGTHSEGRREVGSTPDVVPLPARKPQGLPTITSSGRTADADADHRVDTLPVWPRQSRSARGGEGGHAGQHVVDVRDHVLVSTTRPVSASHERRSGGPVVLRRIDVVPRNIAARCAGNRAVSVRS